MTRVLVVDQSSFFRKALVHVLQSSPDIHVVGEANKASCILDLVEKQRPDVMTLDVDFSDGEAFTVLGKLHATSPKLPVIVLSTLNQNQKHELFEFMASGMVDFVDKSKFNLMDFDRLSRELIERIYKWNKSLEQSSLRGDLSPRTKVWRKMMTQSGPLPHLDWSQYDLCIIGASTGGPTALHFIFEHIKADFPLPLLLVQHIPSGFSRTFSDRLNRAGSLCVKEAKNGTRLAPGTALLIPSGMHAHVTPSLGVILFTEKLGKFHVPSVDVVMQSAAASLGKRVLGVLLTGMGSDGADGMVSILQAGGMTLAESEESCLIYGMPRAAHIKGGVRHMLSLPDIAKLFRK